MLIIITETNMKTVGIIAEYNPFHNGHKHQIEQLKNMGYDCVVCVCSQSFVQRGQAALFAPSIRTKAALSAGADLVISLPTPYAVQSAEGFAYSAVYILSALNVCDALAFGAEHANEADLMQTASVLCSQQFNIALKNEINTGITYAKAHDNALNKVMPNVKNLLKTPNNVLGIEYCKALIKLQQSAQNEHTQTIQPIKNVIALNRIGANHDEPLQKGKKTSYASASAIRKVFYKSENIKHIKNYVPKQCYKIYKQAYKAGMYTSLEKYETAVLSRLRGMTLGDMQKIRLANEGLHNYLYKAVKNTKSLQALYKALKTKRYTMARLRRLCVNSALNYTDELPTTPPYAHILGASNSGLLLLKKIKKCGKIMFSQSLAQISKHSNSAKTIADAHATAEDFAQLCLKKPQQCNSAYTDKFVLFTSE